MARNYKIQLFVDLKQATNILKYKEERHLKSESEAVYRIISEYFFNLDQQDQAISRLNKVIQGYNDKIKNLEYELKQKGNENEYKNREQDQK